MGIKSDRAKLQTKLEQAQKDAIVAATNKDTVLNDPNSTDTDVRIAICDHKSSIQNQIAAERAITDFDNNLNCDL